MLQGASYEKRERGGELGAGGEGLEGDSAELQGRKKKKGGEIERMRET